MIHVSGNDQHGQSQAGQSSGDWHRLFSVAAVMKITAKDDEIGINALQLVKLLDTGHADRQDPEFSKISILLPSFRLNHRMHFGG